MRRLPSSTLLWQHYPSGSATEVKNEIGGGVNMAWVNNTCVVRMSQAFNKSGAPIPGGYPGLTTTYGANGMRYAFRVREFKRYLERAYKPPDVDSPHKSSFVGHTGIIGFWLPTDPDADGHFDIWNGNSVKYFDNFYRSTQNWLWIC